MVIIGITGGIGSGKSTVARFFSESGVSVFDADQSAKQFLETVAKDAVLEHFGEDILAADGSIYRKKLASIVFADPTKLESLNSLLHPHVFAAFDQWKSGLPKSTRYAMAEAALMFESGMFERMDYTLAVVADEEVRIQRTCERDGTDPETVHRRMKHQISEEQLLELSDFQLRNNGSLEELHSKIRFFSILFPTLRPPVPEQ